MNRRRRNHNLRVVLNIAKIVVAILSIVLSAYTQVLILHPGAHYVYIGNSVSVFVTGFFIYYNAFMNMIKYFWFE